MSAESQLPTRDPKQPTAWLPLLAVAIVPPIIHLFTAGNYGIFRDEYYYLACARQLDWGYVDHPPLSIAVLALMRVMFGESVFALRLVPALCGSALVLLTGRIAGQLGGGGFAQVMAGVSMAIAGVAQVITGFYSMNALDLVIWAAAWSLLASWAADPAPRRMIQLGLLLGFGLLNKIGILILGAALALAILLTPLRRKLWTPAPYLGCALALLIFSPYIAWQMTHGWPTLEFIANAKEFKIAGMSPIAFMGEIVLEQQPANLLVWTVGLGWLLIAARARSFRLLGWTFAVGLALLMLQGAKPYYAAGLFPVLFAAGACAWEGFTQQGWRRWLRPVVLIFLIGSGVFFLPLGFPVLPVEQYARWQEWTGIAPAAQEVGHTSELPQHYSDRFGWDVLAEEVWRIVKALPPDERDGVVIFALNYGQAGALEYWGRRYELPRVVSGHNSYSFWSPEELQLETIIVIGGREEDLSEAFETLERAGSLEHPWALENGRVIWVGRGYKRTWAELRERIRSFI